MKTELYDFTTAIRILKLRKERHELLASNKATDIHQHHQISSELYELTRNPIYLRF
jgi:hypothetical protein